MRHRELEWPGCEDARLYAQAWLPDDDARRVIVISHGLAEHGGRYAALARHLVDGGNAVYALDHRGHGRSSGPRANIGRFAHLVSDLGTSLGRAQREHPGIPLVLFGHSMGGAIALACALRYPDRIRCLVLSAPALAAGEAVPPFKLWLARLLSRVAPNTGALTLPAAAVSRDPAVVQAYEADPLVYRGAIPARTLVELLDAMRGFADVVARLRMPVLIQHGAADQLVPLAATRPLYDQLGSRAERTLHCYDELFHEVYNEPERERVIADLDDWLGVTLPVQS